MSYFSYTAVSAEGKRKKGYIEAPTLEEATRKLQTQESIILSLSSCRQIRSLIPRNQLASIIDQIANLLSVGMPLYESLVQVADHYRSARFHPILLGVCDKIQAGASLAEAFKAYHFPPILIAMVHAGQLSGQLDHTLRELALLMAKEQKIRKQFLAALLYPLLLLSFSALLIVILLTCVIPSLEMLFEERSVSLLTRCVFGCSHLLTIYWPWLLSGMTLISYVIFYSMKTSHGKTCVEKGILRLPLLRTLIIYKEIGRFSQVVALLLKGGVPLLQAVEMGRQSLSWVTLQNSLAHIEQRLVEGRLLSHELRTIPWFPPLATRLMAIGEEGGNLEAMLEKISELYEGEVDVYLNRLTTLAQPILLLAMGGIIGLIMMAVLLPLTDVNAFL